ncbi:S24/S26 family peptidase [Candidatus Woesearchaeota archaeon]|nr:S24/S26 family peptidase [Candidatus Woesearchaeota archaeon]
MKISKIEIIGLTVVAAIILVSITSFADVEMPRFARHYIQAHHTDFDYTYNGSLLLVEGVTCFQGTGASMNPTMFAGNMHCYIPYRNQTLAEGNIIQYHSGDSIRSHRIIAIYGNELYVAGDNNNYDEKINKSAVQGILAVTLYS